MAPHDFKAFPELRDEQFTELYFQSPHKQIVESFRAEVVRVHDGDTITVRVPWRDFDFPIRFAFIDTKELSEGGGEAGDYLRSKIEGESIEVIVDKENRVGRYGRLVGEIIHKGINMNQEMIDIGLAVPFSQRGEGKLPNLDKELNLKKWF